MQENVNTPKESKTMIDKKGVLKIKGFIFYEIHYKKNLSNNQPSNVVARKRVHTSAIKNND